MSASGKPLHFRRTRAAGHGNYHLLPQRRAARAAGPSDVIREGVMR